MAEARYRDLCEFGLPLVTPASPEFAALAEDIESRLAPGDSGPPPYTPDGAAVLLNRSGRTIVAVEFFWRLTNVEGETRTSRFSGLGSSVQREVLTGRAQARRDLGSFILPGSKRLITERGIFGNNLDVLTPEELPRARGYCGGFGGDGGVSRRAHGEIAAVELVLDLAILDDGLCAGPDEGGLFDDLTTALELEQTAAQEAVDALRAGASVGRVFEIIRPLARRPQGGRRSRPASALLECFAHEAIRVLVDADPQDTLAWFERAAQPPALHLHRPS
jgi:hypothetical protein